MHRKSRAAAAASARMANASRASGRPGRAPGGGQTASRRALGLRLSQAHQRTDATHATGCASQCDFGRDSPRDRPATGCDCAPSARKHRNIRSRCDQNATGRPRAPVVAFGASVMGGDLGAFLSLAGGLLLTFPHRVRTRCRKAETQALPGFSSSDQDGTRSSHVLRPGIRCYSRSLRISASVTISVIGSPGDGSKPSAR